MRILVSGANGFIGTNTCSYLAGKANTIIPVIRSHKEAEFFASFYPEVVVADLMLYGSLKETKSLKPDVVVHLAAEKPEWFGGKDARNVAEANAKIDRNVLGFCRDTGIGLIYASGTSVYGLEHDHLMTESDPIDPIGPYVEQKAESERLSKEVLSLHGLPFTSLRICAPYGPGQRAKTVLKIFIERAIEGSPLLYHGSGTRQQDFTYVEDIAKAISLAVEKGKSGVFNISGGEPVTMKHLAELVVHSVNGCQSVIQTSGEEDPQEGSTALFSVEKAKRELGWVPRTSLASGIKKCVLYEMAEKR
jgi:UDP-glucose 4-epimerase